MNSETIGIVLTVGFAGGIIAAFIAYSKTHTTGAFAAWFVIGFLFPLFGVILAACIRTPPKPPGWYTDPWDQSLVRYYDGRAWTWHTQARAAQVS